MYGQHAHVGSSWWWACADFKHMSLGSGRTVHEMCGWQQWVDITYSKQSSVDTDILSTMIRTTAFNFKQGGTSPSLMVYLDVLYGCIYLRCLHVAISQVSIKLCTWMLVLECIGPSCAITKNDLKSAFKIVLNSREALLCWRNAAHHDHATHPTSLRANDTRCATCAVRKNNRGQKGPSCRRVLQLVLSNYLTDFRSVGQEILQIWYHYQLEMLGTSPINLRI